MISSCAVGMLHADTALIAYLLHHPYLSGECSRDVQFSRRENQPSNIVCLTLSSRKRSLCETYKMLTLLFNMQYFVEYINIHVANVFAYVLHSDQLHNAIIFQN